SGTPTPARTTGAEGERGGCCGGGTDREVRRSDRGPEAGPRSAARPRPGDLGRARRATAGCTGRADAGATPCRGGTAGDSGRGRRGIRAAAEPPAVRIR